MAHLKFVIRNYKDCKNKDGKLIIWLRYTHKSVVTYISSSRTINPDFWDKKGYVKSAYKGFSSFNMFLDKFRQRAEDYVHEALCKDKDPTVEFIREKLKQKKEDKSKELPYIDFFTYFLQFINVGKTTKAKSTITGYQNTFRHFKSYEKHIGKPLTFDSFDMNFYDSFLYYLSEIKGLGRNSCGKQIKTLKTMLNDAIERGHKVNEAFKSRKFKVLSEDAETIYLTEEEIDSLINLELYHTPKLERVRDLFVVGCYTGLRFSDFSQIQPENIKTDYIQIRTQKTSQNIVIPLHPCVKMIMDKYKECPNNLPPSITNQKMNDYLKEIGKLAGFEEKIIITKLKGNNRVERVYKKYELISTHCARRSFATNLYKQGFPAISIMKITGHKTEKAFMRYIKINEEENALHLKQFWESRHEKLLLHPSPILQIA